MSNFDDCKVWVTIPHLHEKLGLDCSIFQKKKFCNPWRDDKRPSMWLFDGDKKAHDGSSGETYDIGDWYASATGCEPKLAPVLCAQFLVPSLDKFTETPPAKKVKPIPTFISPVGGNRIQQPADLRRLNEKECRALAELRGLSPGAFEIGTRIGCLYFATICRHESWVLTDVRGYSWEARRMNGKDYPAAGEFAARKSHTLKGSIKSWPVGLYTLNAALDSSQRLLIVEGMPGYVEGLELVLASPPDKGHYSVAAILGAGVREFSVHALEKLKEREEVRILADNDPAGRAASERWEKWLLDHGVNASSVEWPDGCEFKDLGEVLAKFKGDEQALSDFAGEVL